MQKEGGSTGNPEWGYKLNFSPSPGDITHDFCGAAAISGANCPNCNKPLLRLLSLSAKDPRLNLSEAHTSAVHLLYCWTCSIPFGEFSYEVDRDGAVQILELPPRQPDNEFGPAGPYEGYTGRFPHHRVGLVPLKALEQQILVVMQEGGAEADYEAYFGHQVGGSPFIYNPQERSCPRCSKAMPLLASICDNASDSDDFPVDPSLTFADSGGGVQIVFHFCRDCSIVSAYHSCD